MWQSVKRILTSEILAGAVMLLVAALLAVTGTESQLKWAMPILGFVALVSVYQWRYR